MVSLRHGRDKAPRMVWSVIFMSDQTPDQQLASAGIPVPTRAGEVTRFQAFVTETIHRRRMKGAPYNPRYLPAKAKAKLRETIGAVGLVQPIVWNRRTENIVGGHQRISQIDALEGHDDYQLTVAIVDVDEKREKELNILLNNTEVTGEWDLEKLKSMLDSEIDLLNTGFDNASFMQMFGEAPSQPKADHQAELSKQMQAVKDAYKKLDQMSKNKDDTDFYCVVVFGSTNERGEFLKEFGFPDNRYIDGRTLVQVFKGNLKQTELARHGHEVQNLGIPENKTEGTEKPA